jgi:hypothetical protein
VSNTTCLTCYMLIHILNTITNPAHHTATGEQYHTTSLLHGNTTLHTETNSAHCTSTAPVTDTTLKHIHQKRHIYTSEHHCIWSHTYTFQSQLGLHTHSDCRLSSSLAHQQSTSITLISLFITNLISYINTKLSKWTKYVALLS